MEERIVDYFGICGVPESKTRKFIVPEPTPDPITDICVINQNDREPVPEGYKIVDKTTTGHDANLNHGSYYSSSMYLCVRRGRDKAPLKMVGVFYESTDQPEKNMVIIRKTPSNFDANVNNSSSKTFLTFQRSGSIEPCNQLVVTDVCVILGDKDESPPHAYMKINKNLNKGLFGSTVYLCYKLTHFQPPYLLYSPVLLDRYPQYDQTHFPITEFLPHFCLPRGAAIQSWPGNVVSMPKPKSLNSVLTSEQANKLYVASIWFYDQISPLELTSEELKFFGFQPNSKNIDRKFFRTKAICFISRWPFLDQFKEFGTFLVETFASGKITKRSLSLEAYIYCFMENIPFPRSDLPNIQVVFERRFDESGKKLEDRSVTFSQTFDDLPFFSRGASFEKLLMNLRPENCLYLILFALTEQKILLHTLRPGILAEVAEAIITMIFPFNWHCPYIPLCPMNFYSVVHAPLPFIIGSDSGCFDHCEPPDDVASIDLDTNSIYLSEKKDYLNLSILPKKELKQLKSKLEDLYTRYNNNNKSSESYQKTKRRLDIECQEAFLYFMTSLLRDFTRYLIPTDVRKVGATDPESLFDMERFLKSRDSSSHTFYEEFIKTQMFTKFIEERSLISDKSHSLAFFDDCVERLKKYENDPSKNVPTLIEIDDQQKSDKFFIVCLEAHIKNATYQVSQEYDQLNTHSNPGIGTLNHELFAMFNDKQTKNIRKSFNSTGTASSSSGKDSIDSSTIDSDLQIYPLVKITKYEMKKLSKIAEKVHVCPVERAKYLLHTTYGIWFLHFPAFSHVLSDSNIDSLDLAFQILKRMHSMHFSTSEEYCYRVLMILCSVYNRPALAVKIYLHAKKNGVSMNAITYGYYNKAVLESKWLENSNRNTNDRWKLLKNVFSVVNFMNKKMKKTDSTIDSDSDNERLNKTLDIEENDRQTEIENQDSMKNFSIRSIKDEHIEGHIVVSDGESNKTETNSIKSEDISNGKFSKIFTTPIKDALTNMDLFSNKSKVGSTLRASFRFSKFSKFRNKRDDFTTTPTKMSKSHTFDDGHGGGGVEIHAENDSQINSSTGTTPNIDRTFGVPNIASNQSPWTAKHSEYVLSTFKSAANRIKVQFASNSLNSPVKNQFLSSNLLAQIKNFTTDKELFGSNSDNISDCGIALTNPTEVLDNLFMYRDLFDTANMFYLGPILDPPKVEPKIALVIEMISASVCNACQTVVYDEEIMSGWSSMDSDLNSKCSNNKCGQNIVPNFTIFLKDYRKSDGSISETSYNLLDSVSVPYLSPMVLRKELESILSIEGYSCLLNRKFLDNHTIIYWNLLWYFQRINLPTHISGMALLAETLKRDSIPTTRDNELNYLNVKVECRWDYSNFYKHQSAVPKHRKWLEIKNGEVDNEFEEDIHQLLEKVNQQDLGPAIKYLISKRVASESKSFEFPSIYRDLFFLTVCESDIPLDVFDKLYCNAFNELSDKEREGLRSDDSPPNVFTIFCRSLFKQLTLV